MSRGVTSVITLLTDYGLEDGYVAACHGVIAGIAPESRIIDVGHLIPAGDIRRGAAILAQTLPYLPVGVHLAVVDPALGGTRRGVVIESHGRIFIGPDNGVLSWAVQAAGGTEGAYEITNQDLFLSDVSPTFHGRDVFAPVAAHLATGRRPSDVGPPLPADRLISLPAPTCRVRDGAVEGEVLSVDRHGNVQLSITAKEIEGLGARVGEMLTVWLGRRQVMIPYRETFSAVPPDDLVAFADSAGLVALAINTGDASERLGLPPGAHVRLCPGR
jgi:S-adenosylmethionine hydrolase